MISIGIALIPTGKDQERLYAIATELSARPHFTCVLTRAEIPHVTLGHLRANAQAKEFSQIALPIDISFEKLIVFKVEPLGVCKEILYEQRI